jgi:hypothetical protein
MSRFSDLTSYKGILPYSSELFGVYQPLLGWKSVRSLHRYSGGYGIDRAKLYESAVSRFQANLQIQTDGQAIQIGALAPAKYAPQPGAIFNSTLVREIARALPAQYSDNVWDQLTPALVQRTLDGPVKKAAIDQYKALWQRQNQARAFNVQVDATQAVTTTLQQETAIASMLLDFKNRGAIGDLKHILYDAFQFKSLVDIFGAGTADNPFDTIDPHKDLDRVGLSPIGLVHLFREYFFELDTFLGVPVSHVWLSPGGSVELVEVSTRKTTVEQTIEASTQVVRKSSTTNVTQDDLSEAVKQDNQQNTKLGATANSSQNWVWGSANESASFGLDTTQQNARENTHKQMRQQTQTLSEEITTNYKTTLKTVSETTDVSSKRYVLAITTDHLINYELRRKMRQIGVQVQDVGTYMCWQTYVDDAGKSLGIANLIHMTKPPDIPADPNPQSVPVPDARIKADPVTITWHYTFDDDQCPPFVPITTVQLIAPRSGYIFDNAEIVVTSGPNWGFRYNPQDSSTTPEGETNVTSVVVGLNGGFTDDSNPDLTLQFTAFFVPSKALRKTIDDQNAKIASAATNTQNRAYEEAYFAAAADRIKQARDIKPRPYDELREEERIVVYRALLQDMLTKGLTFPDDRTRHVVSELLNSIFDIDKMLYFVAPEWWRPRLHSASLDLIPFTKPDGSTQLGADGKPLMIPDPSHVMGNVLEAGVSWGGAEAARDSNYYITGDSTPARLGSSLGWLLQLDGDNLRNAFLNSPWVKAVIPIRPHHERAALNWLQQVEGTNGIGPGDMYAGPEPAFQGLTILEVLQKLADAVDAKHTESITTQQYANPSDPANNVTSTPVDVVYEQGFDPLQGGFRVAPSPPPKGNFEIFDQWIEILPTDQVVPVEVKYDPKTGRQT